MTLTPDSEVPFQPIADPYHAVDGALRGWGGFVGLQAAMSRFPRTDVFVAGGVVRDLLRQAPRAPRDFDFFIGGVDVNAFLQCLEHSGTLQRGPFGSPRWFPHGAGSRYADVIVIERFDNGLWKCRDIVDALNQFDFTANAVAVDLRLQTFFDPQNGARDALEGVLRSVRFDFPDQPIAAHTSLTRLCILWFRLYHYASELGLKIEPVTLEWLQERRHYACHAAEFSRVFFTPRFPRT